MAELPDTNAEPPDTRVVPDAAGVIARDAGVVAHDAGVVAHDARAGCLDPDRLHRAIAREALRIDVVDTIDSTNRALMEAPFDALPAPPRLLVALAQSAGRGRRGRHWLSEHGRSLAFSVAWERVPDDAAPPSGLPIAIGAALAAVLASDVPDIRLKWPNDLQRDGRKVGGILVESRRERVVASTDGAAFFTGGLAPERAIASTPMPVPAGGSRVTRIERFVIGVGLNLNAPADVHGRVGQPAGGLFEGELPADAGERIIGVCVPVILDAIETLLDQGLQAFSELWTRFDAMLGRRVCLLDGGQVEFEGLACGIDDDGALKVETSAGMRRVISGELSLRDARSARLASGR